MHRLRPTLLAMVAVLAACGQGGSDSGTAPVQASQNRYAMANACYRVQDASTGLYLRVTGDDGVATDAGRVADATPFFMKPTGLGRYLFYTPDKRFLSLTASNEALAAGAGDLVGTVGREVAGVGDTLLWLPPPLDPVGDTVDWIGDWLAGQAPVLADGLRGTRSLGVTATPSDGSEWTVDQADAAFTIVSTTADGALGNETGPTGFHFVAADGCTPYPEAELNATGEPFKGTMPDGTVFGYAESHMHLGGSEALGGKLGYGRPFHRFGIPHALGNCEANHGPNGVLDVFDTVVNPDSDAPPHDTVGWPTYKSWPTWGSQTHHQTYYIWLKRAWMGGLRFMVNHLVANEELCQIWPLAEHDCNEMENLQVQLDLVLDLQDYIDAQAGGPGKGFFRIATSSAEARRFIEDGKMAVMLGTENEKIFDCGEYLDQPLCTREHIDEQLDLWYDKGIRAIFPIHLLDNAFGGTRLSEDPALSTLYQTANVLATGHPFATLPCDQVDETAPHGETTTDEGRGLFDTLLLQVLGPPPLPPVTGCVRNARGITELGDYFLNAMIDRGVLIETDHTGTIGRRRMLDIAAERDVPVLSGHIHAVEPKYDSRRTIEVGGIISNLPDEPSPVSIAFIEDLVAAYLEVNGSADGLATGLGSDINGIHNQPPPRENAAEDPLKYPFTSYDGRVVFDRQVTGERVFDLNTDGVAHYGLYPDFIADMQQQEGGEQALKYLFRSAEAYLQAWERAERASRR